MPQLTIRNLDQAVIDNLKARAKRSGRSMEEEARRALSSLTADRSELIEELRRVRAVFGNRRFSDSADIVRAMRDERAGLEPER